MLSFNLKSASHTLVSHSLFFSFSSSSVLSNLFWLFCYHAEGKRSFRQAEGKTADLEQSALHTVSMSL